MIYLTLYIVIGLCVGITAGRHECRKTPHDSGLHAMYAALVMVVWPLFLTILTVHSAITWKNPK